MLFADRIAFIRPAVIILLLTALTNNAAAQPDVSTVSVRVQHIKGCVDLFYPSDEGQITTEKDRHELEKPNTGGSLVAALNNVTRSMSESRDGSVHTEEELAAAGYSKVEEGGKTYREKEFTVAHKTKFTLCIKPTFGGDKVTLEARHSDYESKTKTSPDDLLRLATAGTTQKIRDRTTRFDTQAAAAIAQLVKQINQTILPLQDIEIIQMWRSTGIEKQVQFTFAGGTHTVPVKLRRIME